MVTRDFSGFEIAKVLVNKGNFTWVRTRGDHAILLDEAIEEWREDLLRFGLDRLSEELSDPNG